MKIFITGGTGFIGKHMVKKLREDKDNELFLLSKDLADIESWKKEVEDFRPDVAIHLAWEGLPDYSAKMSIRNLNYGLNLMNFLAEIGCKKILGIGSSWEVLPQPFNAFSSAKNALHWLGQKIAQENNINFIWARLFFVYGPGQRENSLIPYLINCKKTGNKPEIKTPDAKNDFIYVEDIAEALAMIVKKCNKSALYNIGSGQLIRVRDIVKIIFGECNLPTKGEDTWPADFYADISRIRKEIDWQPKTDLKEGIRKTILYYEQL